MAWGGRPPRRSTSARRRSWSHPREVLEGRQWGPRFGERLGGLSASGRDETQDQTEQLSGACERAKLGALLI
eukprot:2805470-Pyramimonas_sp.AAC.1